MLRFGTIGSGWIVDEYIHGAKDSGLWELTAVYSRTAERAQAFAQKHGAPLWFTDLEEMAASPQKSIRRIGRVSLRELSSPKVIARLKPHSVWPEEGVVDLPGYC